jgi:hypothetical protein
MNVLFSFLISSDGTNSRCPESVYLNRFEKLRYVPSSSKKCSSGRSEASGLALPPIRLASSRTAPLSSAGIWSRSASSKSSRSPRRRLMP